MHILIYNAKEFINSAFEGLLIQVNPPARFRVRLLNRELGENASGKDKNGNIKKKMRQE